MRYTVQRYLCLTLLGLFQIANANLANAAVSLPVQTVTLDEVDIDLSENKAKIGAWVLPLPMLLEVSSDGDVTQAHISAEDEFTGLAQVLADLPAGQGIAWIDQCDLFQAFGIGILMPGESELCILMGATGGNGSLIPYRTSSDLTQTALQNAASATTGLIEPLVLAEMQIRMGDKPFVPTRQPSEIGLPVLMTSAGLGHGPSQLRRLTNHEFESGLDLSLAPGLSLIGFSATGAPRLLDHVFNCDPTQNIANKTPWAQIVSNASSDILSFAVVAHDSAFCGPNITPIAGIVGGLPLPELRNLGFRQPYIGVFDHQQTYFEHSNAEFGKLRVFLTGSDFRADVPTVLTQDEIATAFAVGAPSVVTSVQPVAVVQDAVAAQLISCILAPQSAPKTLAPLPPVNQEMRGSALSQLLAGASGFWDLEENGVWFGAPNGQIAFDLPQSHSQPTHLRLTGTTFRNAALKIGLSNDGTGVAAPQLAQGNFSIELPIPLQASADSTIRAKIDVENADWSCPANGSDSLDTRSLAFFLSSASFVDLPQESALPVAQQQLPPAPAKFSACPITPIQTSTPLRDFPLDAEIALHDAVHQGLLVLGHGWSAQQRGGYRAQSQQNALAIRLPSTNEPLVLTLRDASGATEVLDLVWDDAVIREFQTTNPNSVAMDLTSLPRNLDITLSVRNAQSNSCGHVENAPLTQAPLITSVMLTRQRTPTQTTALSKK